MPINQRFTHHVAAEWWRPKTFFGSDLLRYCCTNDSIQYTRWKFNSSPLKISHPKRNVIFQPLFFRGELLNFGGVFAVEAFNWFSSLIAFLMTLEVETTRILRTKYVVRFWKLRAFTGFFVLDILLRLCYLRCAFFASRPLGLESNNRGFHWRSGWKGWFRGFAKKSIAS